MWQTAPAKGVGLVRIGLAVGASIRIGRTLAALERALGRGALRRERVLRDTGLVSREAVHTGESKKLCDCM